MRDEDLVPPNIPTRPDEDLFCHELPTIPRPEVGKILVTGASGYIGGRLVPELIARGYQVRAMVRGDPDAHQQRWPKAEVIVADALEEESLCAALQGVHAAYYLIHSLLLGPKDFEEADLAAAANFREAAVKQGISRIIYLGGLGGADTSRSAHLRSRMEVATELAGDGVTPLTILRAATIIGSGSASYELIRHLAAGLPVLPIPHWARNGCQPIAVRDVVKYLVGVLETPATTSGSYDIGGRDILSYEQMIRIFSETLKKKIALIPVPLSSPRFYAYMASLLTPVPAQITACLMEGIKDEAICRDDGIKDLIPFEPLGYREAIVRALKREERDVVLTRWSDAYPPAHELATRFASLHREPQYRASRSLLTDKPAADLFASVRRIGGATGWFNSNWMWRMRGMVDRLLMGVGMTRGRKRHSVLELNDVIDFWRVEDIKADRRLLLRAEMKLPGSAWLEFGLAEEGDRRRLSVNAYFHTTSLFGRLYWYFFLPFHRFIFSDLIKQIDKRA